MIECIQTHKAGMHAFLAQNCATKCAVGAKLLYTTRCARKSPPEVVAGGGHSVTSGSAGGQQGGCHSRIEVSCSASSAGNSWPFLSNQCAASS